MKTEVSPVVLDYETIELLEDGSSIASTEFYKENFRADSCAFSTRTDSGVKSWFVRGEDSIRAELQKLAQSKTPLVAHNIQFEMGVSKCRFPGLELNWYADTMRMVQNYDNGGDESDFDIIEIPGETEDDETDYKKEYLQGLGLVKSVKRILGREDHKKEAHEWLRANHNIKEGKEGANLHLLPEDILERYNVADTESTLELYEYILNEFRDIRFDWAKDHTLFLSSVKDLVESQIRGIPVDREGLSAYAKATEQEITDIGVQFLTQFAEPIKEVERDKLLEEIRKRKTLRGRKNYVKRIRSDEAKYKEDILFNPGSNKQLQSLFVEHLKCKPIFFTDKGSPSFKSAHLGQWGEGGKILLNRRKRLIVYNQSDAILTKSAYDSRLHIQLRACGTVTGRYAGTGGVNIQALSRRDRGLMDKLLPDPGYVFISSDMSAGEPSILTEYTRDANYKYFCFDGIGKQPFYDNGILMIDDVYLAYASVCPLFKDAIYQAFKTGWNGKSFVECWMEDPEFVKDKLKGIRKHAKWICLGFGYGLGPKTLYKKAIEAGLHVTMKDCKAAFAAYWDLFSGIKAYAQRLEAHVTKHGWFQNPFGYRFTPKEVRKSFNGMIQSSVSGLFHWYGILMKHYNPFALYVTTIHDENLYMCPEDRVDEFRNGLENLTKHINSELKWCIDLRFGMVKGNNLFEAK